jgi:clan AA aspartic protease (TIGR02281 family)
MQRLAILLAVGSLQLAVAASADIYRWTDADGTIHFTEDLSQVPRQHRADATRKAPADARGSVQTYSPPAHLAPTNQPGSRGPIQIPFERRGTLMWVEATVNDRARVPFLIDTGASGVSLPSEVITQLGIPIRSDTPRVTVGTANGFTRVPVVQIDSIQLGGARVEGLDATVNPTMGVGLLGGSFFNNYRYSVDSAASVITLVPNEGVRGGEAADQWRERFQALRADIRRLETYLEERDVTRANRRIELEGNLDQLKRNLAALETEANRVGVPQAWRK